MDLEKTKNAIALTGPPIEGNPGTAIRKNSGKELSFNHNPPIRGSATQGFN